MVDSFHVFVFGLRETLPRGGGALEREKLEQIYTRQ